jgi:hypothetical protein
VVNTDRGFVVEVIVGQALGAEWRWLARDFTGWDFQHETGCRLEVKHSAARQTWASHKASAPSFDIKARTGYWDNDGATWIAAPGRHAHIYVFAHHPVIDESADHRDAGQWRFYVVRTEQLEEHLPAAKTIRLGKMRQLAEEVGWGDLRAADFWPNRAFLLRCICPVATLNRPQRRYPQLAQRRGEAVLPGVGGELPQDQGGGHGARMDRGGNPQDFRPMGLDERCVDAPGD